MVGVPFSVCWIPLPIETRLRGIIRISRGLGFEKKKKKIERTKRTKRIILEQCESNTI